MRRSLVLAAAAVLAACGGSPSSSPEGIHRLPASEVDDYETAYIAEVVAVADGGDLAEGAGEHVIVRNNWDLRADLGGWWIEDADANRLRLGVGRQVEAQGELRVHTACGENTEEAVFACLDEPVLGDDGDVLILRDSAGGEVMRFAYGDAG